MEINKLFKRNNFDKQINQLPKEVKWCKTCTISNQRPRIQFSSEGICSACLNKEYKKSINWEKRHQKLLTLLDENRSKDGSWDVIVPSSGGKDSGYVAHKLKYEYGMNPLLVTWSPLIYTDIGLKNFNSLVDSGFTTIKCSPNGIIHRNLARLSFEEFGDAFHVFVLGQMYYPLHMALKFNIKLIFYGENGEVEYAGDPKAVDKPFISLIEDGKWAKSYLKGTQMEDLISFAYKNKNYINEQNTPMSELQFYNPPNINEMSFKGISKNYYFNYYEDWYPQENYYYCVENTGFKANPERSEGTYSKYASLDDKMDGFHYYMRYIKFGLGRCVEDTAHEIRDNHITREEGIALMNRYEGEFLEKYFPEFLEYLNITEEHFWQVVDSWRLPHLWEKNKNVWKFKYPIK